MNAHSTHTARAHRTAHRTANALRVILVCAIASLAMNVNALDVPAWTGAVNDVAGVMSAEEKASLGEYLSAVNSQTGVQVGVLTVPSLDGESIESFSMRVADSWKLGSADKDNGAILVVSIADRDLRIEVGYGLEETLTDMKCGLIIRNVIIPEFKAGNYGAGIVAGAKSVVGVATGEITIADEASGESETSGVSSDAGGIGMIFVIILFMMLRLAALGRRRSRGGLGGFLGPFLLGSALSNMNRHSGSGWTNRSGGFGGGGFSGGGFSGGGGGFGGGGASGHW